MIFLGYEEDNESDVESDNSLDSKISDRTFQAPDSENESDSDQSFMTVDSGRYSRNSTSMLEELQFLRDSTPMKEFMRDSGFGANSPGKEQINWFPLMFNHSALNFQQKSLCDVVNMCRSASNCPHFCVELMNTCSVIS